MTYRTHTDAQTNDNAAFEGAHAEPPASNRPVHNQPGVRIHPTAEVSRLAMIGAHTQIWNNSQIREEAQIGSNCILGKDVYIDFGVQIGDNVKIQNGVSVYHGTTLESGVFVGPGVIFTNDKHPRATTPEGRIKGNNDWEVGEIHVGHGASIGAGAIIMPDVRIGSYAMVGAGAVVTHNVPNFALVVGAPARQRGFVCVCGNTLGNLEGNTFGNTSAPCSTGTQLCHVCGAEYELVEAVNGEDLDRNIKALHR